MSRQSLSQRRDLRQQRDQGALHMHLSQRIFRKQLRVNAGGADPAAEHGSSRRDPSRSPYNK